jgi:hypothetical protein
MVSTTPPDGRVLTPLFNPGLSEGFGLPPVEDGPAPPVSPPVSVGATMITLVSVDNVPSLLLRIIVVVELVLPFVAVGVLVLAVLIVPFLAEAELSGAEVTVELSEGCVLAGTVELVTAVVLADGVGGLSEVV